MLLTLPKIFPVASHTDQVGPGSTFVAINGLHEDGVSYTPLALKKGASTIVLEKKAELDAQTRALIASYRARILRVDNARRALAELSARAAGYPAEQLKIIGITGTKGKTSTAALLFHLLQSAGISAALISTIGNKINGHSFAPDLTTPQPDYLHQYLKLCVQNKVQWVVMEVACHAVSLDRIHGISFDAVAILNIEREHLEFYSSMNAYAQAKIDLLSYRKKHAPAFLCKEDNRLSPLTAAHIRFFSLQDTRADLYAKYLAQEKSCALKINNKLFKSPALMGKYSGYNMLAAYGLAQVAAITPEQMIEGFATFAGVAGRLEQHALPNGAIAVIDYAHNPFSYHAFFSTMRAQTDQFIVVFGAGGNRDAGRRPQMGAIVAEYADLMIITTDNPRFEKPEAIVQDILSGIKAEERKKVIIEPDRKKAIKIAYAHSRSGAIIALIGKGPDEYQLIGKKKIPFSERKILKEL